MITSLPLHLLEDIIELDLVVKERAKELYIGIYSSVYKGTGFDFEEHKEYEPGIDEVRRIDWKVTARDPKKIWVKRFTEEKRLTVWIVADLTDSMKFGFQGMTKKELLTKTAAIIGFSAVHEQNKVGLIIITDRVEETIMPQSSTAHIYRILEDIWSFKCIREETNITKALEEAQIYFKESDMIFSISDFMDCQCFQKDSAFWKQVEELSFRRDLIPIVLDEDRSLFLRNATGNIVLQDLESGKRITLQLSDKSRKLFAKKIEERYWLFKNAFMEVDSRPIFIVRKENLEKLLKFFLIRKQERRLK